MLTRRTVIEIAAETTYGTDPAYAGFTPILAWDVEPDIRGERLERSIMRDTLSPLSHVIGMKDQQITFKTEVKAKGAGTAPESDLLLQACAFSTATYAGTAPIVYTPVSTEASMRSISIFLHKDGNRHKIIGARGTFRAVLEAGKYGIFEWTFQGLYAAVVAVTVPDISAADVTAPRIIYNSNFQIAGFSPVCSSAIIDLGNNVVRRDDLNSTFGVKEFRITGRAPKFEFNADAVVESSNPFWGDWSGGVIDTFAIVAGSGAHGLEVEFSGYFEYDSNKYGDAEGISQYECKASLVSSTPNTQNDELTITFT